MSLPMYQKILDDMRERILSGLLPPHALLPTEMELAGQYQVSRITSKRALEELEREGLIVRRRGVGSTVAPLQEKQERQVAGSIGIVFPHLAMEGITFEYVRGAADFLEQHRCTLSIRRTGDRPEREVLHELNQEGPDGILYLPGSSQVDERSLATFVSITRPVVTIDKQLEGLGMPCVTCDNEGGMRAVVQHLIDLGHRKIAMFCIEPVNRCTTVRDRYLAFCRTLADNGISHAGDHVVSFTQEEFDQKIDTSHLELVVEKLSRLLARGVTAIAAENDMTALFLHMAANKLGKTIPADFSLAGFDDLPLLRRFRLDLTTVRQNAYEIGYKAAEVLYGMLDGETPDAMKFTVPCELVVRSTTAPPGR